MGVTQRSRPALRRQRSCSAAAKCRRLTCRYSDGMDDHGESEETRCADCSGSVVGRRCQVCGKGVTQALRALPPLPARATLTIEQRAVRLVREFKGPTVRDLIAGADPQAATLPGGVRSTLRAIEVGDYAKADTELAGTLGKLLHGPGSRREERAWLLPLLIWCWLTLLGLAFVLALRGGG